VGAIVSKYRNFPGEKKIDNSFPCHKGDSKGISMVIVASTIAINRIG
jgi:hypothetical protein